MINDKSKYINERLRQADESIIDVELLLCHDRLPAAINRIYYGTFYALNALAALYDFETSKHVQLIGWFNKNFIHTKKLPVKYGKIINKAFNRRTKGDYDVFIDIEKNEVQNMVIEMKDFIQTIKTYISTNNTTKI